MQLHRSHQVAWVRAFYALGLASSLVSARAAAELLRVGPGQSYAKPCDAVAAAKANDEIEIATGTYTDSCAISVAGLKLRGSGGLPKVDLSGTDHPAQYKGIYVVSADDVTIENLELMGAHITPDNGENAAAIRLEAKGLTVRGCKIHDNQNGILGGSAGTLTIEHTEFFQNGKGDGCNGGGCTHNLYIGAIDALYFRYNWSHGIATDTRDKGHLLKSRAKANYILYNRLTGESGYDSYEINLPNGGLAIIVGNLIQKGANAGNSNVLSWGEEGATNPDRRMFLVNNTFVNDYGSGTFISASGATLSAKNNLFVGKGTVSNMGSLSADNLSGVDPLFVDKAAFDYHLKAGSPAIGKAVAAGSADQFSLVAGFEYVHPVGSSARGSVKDVGAYEFGTVVTPSEGGATPANGSDGGMDDAGARDAGGMDSDASGTPGTDAASSDTSDGEGDEEEAAGPRRGSGCSVGAAGPAGLDVIWLLLWIACALRRVGWRRVSAGALLTLLLPLGCGSSRDHADAEGGPSGDLSDGGEEADPADAGAKEAETSVDAPLDAGSSSGSADASTQGSSTDGGGMLCSELGWCELSNTKLKSVCPDPDDYPELQANEGCGGVTADWSGGMADEKRNRLLIWGGGHRGYFGNEVYALDLNKLTMQRLNEPSALTGVDLDQCMSPEAYADGRPTSRHTYDGLAYIPEADAMFALAGSGIPCGYAVRGTWILDLAAVASTPLGGAAPWRQVKPTLVPQDAAYGVISDYDPNRKRVIVHDTHSLWAYDPSAGSYERLRDSAFIDYHMTGRVDPKRKLFIAVGGKGGTGGGMQVFDLAPGGDQAPKDWTTQVSGCDALLAATSPGFAYDPQQDRMIGWAGGDTIYTFNPDSKSCTSTLHRGGPGAQEAAGTFGRFRYFPALKLFAVVNGANQNGYTLRLTR